MAAKRETTLTAISSSTRLAPFCNSVWNAARLPTYKHFLHLGIEMSKKVFLSLSSFHSFFVTSTQLHHPQTKGEQTFGLADVLRNNSNLLSLDYEGLL